MKGRLTTIIVNLLACCIFARTEDALAFCRSTTCPVPATFLPTLDHCYPDTFEADCARERIKEKKTPTPSRPLWWRNRCVGYSMNIEGTKTLAFDDVSQVAKKAFSLWTNTTCPSDDAPKCAEGTSCDPLSVGTQGSRVSIDARDLGTVECSDIGYFSGSANQNAIIFRDDNWWDKKKDEARDPQELAITTVTFNSTTGEIRSADLEVNTYLHTFWIDDPSKGEFELLSVFAHEMGHFFGLAHSPDPLSLMYWSASGEKHDLTTDDVAGICAIYSPTGKRRVHESVNNGWIDGEKCDPTPPGGLGQTCTPVSGCSVSSPNPQRNALVTLPFVTVLGAFILRRRRRPRRHE